MQVAMVKTVFISPPKLEHPVQICIHSMMLLAIGNIGLSLFVKQTQNPLYQQ